MLHAVWSKVILFSLQCIWLSKDGHIALSGSWDSTLRVWDLTAGICKQLLISHTEGNASVELLVRPLGSTHVISCGGGCVMQWCIAVTAWSGR